MKIKVGDNNPLDDAQLIIDNICKEEYIEGDPKRRRQRVRADANRAWEKSKALEFATPLTRLADSDFSLLEFIEEPLEKQDSNNKWRFSDQIQALEY